ncbi:hypothetical protein DCS_06300 [Drechmeria coniospora]|uniref:Uncharacterized protein n=1 Tax=Drechmeria coniospora TaxID=98403 RepID=A0A151GBB0_DRECN|nr:hypothetical protein DCS_06300 [Drechmeria coniospora]KYK54343.1 hypothetical protein DCS_06300 [Drechmeria coniospora]
MTQPATCKYEPRPDFRAGSESESESEFESEYRYRYRSRPIVGVQMSYIHNRYSARARIGISSTRGQRQMLHLKQAFAVPRQLLRVLGVPSTNTPGAKELVRL